MTRCDAEIDHEDLILRRTREREHILKFGRIARCKCLDVEVVVFAAGFDFMWRLDLFGSKCVGLQRVH